MPRAKPPLAKPPRAPRKPTKAKAEPKPALVGNHTVLIVDDDEDALFSIKSILESKLVGTTVLTADSAHEAERVLAKHQIHLIVSDYQMPGADGLKFLTDSKAKYGHIPRIMMTAYPEMGLAHTAHREADITAFAVKPLRAEQIVELVRNMLRGRERASFRYSTPH